MLLSSDGNFNLPAFLQLHTKLLHEWIDYDIVDLNYVLCQMLKLLKGKSALLEINAPVNIVGDIHGQYEDLIRIFSAVGPPPQSRYLFLGDYVDRGFFSLEVIMLLFAMKLSFPRKVYLLRGNHECAFINQNYGFYAELCKRFNQSEAANLWRNFNFVFAHLPLAGLIKQRILCMHGGLSPFLNSLDDIRNIEIPIIDPNTGKDSLAMDLLWSDPMHNLTGFTPNQCRSVSFHFGTNVVHETCSKLGIDMVVRGHQVMQTGYGFFCGKRLCTVFSAPDYYSKKNCGAVMHVDKSLQVRYILFNPCTKKTAGWENFSKCFHDDDIHSTYANAAESLQSASTEADRSDSSAD
ncbi:hypothetical protein AB6A40_005204 [Gnathostoma spinigerum]|uniref:Serine/threonine-protein phosphatase n=1 Tax=Gnathostoma spinigerum TaxID=75299 RepID=A0ABD6EQG1_9BILA